MGNIAPKKRIKPTSLASFASVLTITPPRSPDVTILPMPTHLGGSLPKNSVQNTALVPLQLSAL